MTLQPAIQRFGRCATLHRFIRAEDSASAHRIGSAGVHLASGTLDDPAVIIEHAAIERHRVQPYRHAGEENLWRVSIDVRAALLAQGPQAADEAAYRLVTVAPRSAGADVFEYEIEVLSHPGGPTQHASSAAA